MADPKDEEPNATIRALHRVADTMLLLTEIQRKSLDTGRRHREAWEKSDTLYRENYDKEVELLNRIIREVGELRLVLSMGLGEARGEIGKVSTVVTEIKRDHDTDPRFKLPLNELSDGEDIPLSRGLSWIRIVKVTTWVVPHLGRLILPIVLATSIGALLHDCWTKKPTTNIVDQGAPWKP